MMDQSQVNAIVDDTSTILGTIDQILELIIENRSNDSLREGIISFLYTYRLFANPTDLLHAFDKKFWNTAINELLEPPEKCRRFRALKYFLKAWLHPRFRQDFKNPPEFAELNTLLGLLLQWRKAFHKPRNVSKFTLRTESRNHRCLHAARISMAALTSANITYLAGGMDTLSHRITSITNKLQFESTTAKELSVDSVIKRQDAWSSNVEKTSNIVGTSCLTTQTSIQLDTLSPEVIATQLTILDKNLFMDLVLHECLAYVRGRSAPTVVATINQFNHVYYVVLTSILGHQPTRSIIPDGGSLLKPVSCMAECLLALPLMGITFNEPAMESRQLIYAPVSDSKQLETPQGRAEMITKWINVSLELQKQRNFASLKAILTALECNSLQRLQKTWRHLERYHSKLLLQLKSLTQLFSLDNNQKLVRGIMDMPILTTPGLVPYLGIFLSDLNWIHETSDDMVEQSKKPVKSKREVSRSKSTKHSSDTVAARENYAKRKGIAAQHLTDDEPKSMDDDVTIVESTESVLDPQYRFQRSRPRGKSANHVRPSDSLNKTPLATTDCSLPDERLINFTKHCHEASILLKLQALQDETHKYDLQEMTDFLKGFNNLRILSENSGAARSREVESDPSANSRKKSTSSRGKSPRTPNTPRLSPCYKVSAISLNSSASSSASGTGSLSRLHKLRPPLMEQLISSRKSPTVSSASEKFSRLRKLSSSRTPSYTAPTSGVANIDTCDREMVRMRVYFMDNSIQGSTSDHNSVTSTKPPKPFANITVSPNDHVPLVIQRILKKFRNSDVNAEDFCLVQVRSNMPDLVLPDNANVFYGLARNPTDDSPVICYCKSRSTINWEDKTTSSMKVTKRQPGFSGTHRNYHSLTTSSLSCGRRSRSNTVRL